MPDREPVDCASCFIRCTCAEAWALEREKRAASASRDAGERCGETEKGAVKTATES
jgi:hypothetical protein